MTPWTCCDCGARLVGQDRVILVDVYGDEEAKRVNATTKVKARRWFCNHFCLASWISRVTTRKVLPPQRG